MFEQHFIPFMVAGVSAIAVMLLFNGIASIMRSRKKSTRIKSRLAGKRGSNSHVEAQSSSKMLETLAKSAGKLGERLGPSQEEEIDEASYSMIRAGITNPNAPRIFWGVKIMLALGGLGVALLLTYNTRDTIPVGFIACAVMFPCVAGLYIPNIWLSQKISSRRVRLLNGLPDALDLLVVCVEAGMGLDQAIARVSSEIRLTCPDLADEFHTVILELRAGKPRADALKNLSKRVALDDVNSLVTLIVQADAFGTSITSTLRVYSDHMRTTRYQRAEEIAAKMPVKMLFPLIFTILPALFITIMGPAGLHVFKVIIALD